MSTYADLEVSKKTFEEIERLLKEAGYQHLLVGGGRIRMTGLTLTHNAEPVVIHPNEGLGFR